jgi:uncharacterized protein YecT (DUF1311 family)
MKSVAIWLSAVSALALTACGQAKKGATHASANAAVAAAATGQQPVTGTLPTGSSAQQSAASAPSEAEGARTVAASDRAVAGGFAAHRAAGARLARPGGPRERSVEAGENEDTDVLTADVSWGPSDAREHRYSAAYRTCMGSAHGFTAVIADCYNAELVRQGERLSRAFDSAVASRSGERKRRLVLAQREWLHQRDLKCEDDDGPDLLHEGSCRLDLTIKRADVLEDRAG